ncbi:MAG: hypothetical protein IH949_11595, partial [Bacteroidetes bacterium]|nr:hypothetical protein [Bacteroidota bacterium]
TVNDVSDANFSIFIPTITVTAPNGGESWQAGTAQTITWNDNLTENVQIDLYKAGTLNTILAASEASDGSFTWNIPGGTSAASDYTIVITSVNDGAITDVSDADFTITAASFITVTAPNGGESWQSGIDQTITWTDNISENVKIELFKGGGLNFTIVASTPSTGSYTWALPSGTTDASDYTIVITSVNNGAITDVSDANFSIFDSEITLTFPNGGEVLEPGTTYQVTWDPTVFTEKVDIALYKDGVLVDTVLYSSANNDGSHNWEVGNFFVPASDYRIRISKAGDNSIFDFSDADFTIATFSPVITITSPIGGEVWQAGSFHLILWTDNIPEIPANKIKFELWKGGILDTVLFDAEDPDNSKDWNIAPSTTPGNDYRIKLIYVNDPTITSISDANFTISSFVPQITVNFPNGGESLQAGIQDTIRWSDNIPNSEFVKIDLYKGGVLETVLFNSTFADDSKLWTPSLSTTPGSDYRIRITSVDSATVFDDSDADFTIFAPITVTSPNGGENWQVGSSQTITWTDFIAENVKIELFKSGVFNFEITPTTVSNGSLNWIVDEAIVPNSDYTIRITSVNNTNIFDVSDSNFTMFTNDILVTSPNGGENWRSGSAETITWTDNIAENVKIELYKGGVLNTEITASTPSTGSYLWNIPGSTPSASNYQIKITSVNDAGITDLSDANFSIFLPTVTVTAPNGGESWQAGFSQTITWTDNIPEDVKIELFSGGVLDTVIVDTTLSDGSFNWIIPVATIPASNYKVKISSVDDGTVSDSSDANFTIVPSTITVTSPDGGEQWRLGSTQAITWTNNITEDVKIELYRGGVFDTLIIASTPSDGTFNWTVPANHATDVNYRVKITSTIDITISDLSDADFTIFASFITVTSPVGGESWQAGTRQTIVWTDNINENVKIELFKSGVFHTLISNTTSSDGAKFWDIPFAQEPGSDYTVKITSVNNSNLFDFSDSAFTIFAPSITVTSPNGGEVWLTGSTHLINWIDNIAENVEIQLYKSGSFDSQIISSTASDGSYTWNIPLGTVPGSDYTVRISSVVNGVILDESDGSFTIKSFVTVNTPNGAESWLAGTTQNITWTDNFTENVKIDLLKGGVFDTLIIASTPSDGTFAWNIPAGLAAGLDYRVKITSIDNAIVTDTSDADFEIFTAGISISSPNGGESWNAGDLHQVLWSDNITENVVIDLYKGGSFHSTISTSTSSDGSKDWNIDFTLESGSDYKVKITSVTDTTVFDFSNTDFTIIGNFVTVTSPNGGEILLDTEDYIIEWTSNLTGGVEIQLFKGGVFQFTIVSSTSNDGSFNWNIPGSTESGSDYKVQIASVDDGSIFDQSDGDFTIVSNNITVISPNGGESWLTGTSQEITWTTDIGGNVKIDLYKGGVFDSEIINAILGANNTYSWAIPGTTSTGTDYKIRITSVDQPVLFDISNNSFTIFTGGITISSPNGGESWQAGTTQTITWTDDIAENVKIELYKAGVFDSEIIASTPSDGSFTWDIPATTAEASDYTVVITSVNNGTVADTSDANFTISGTIAVISP